MKRKAKRSIIHSSLGARRLRLGERELIPLRAGARGGSDDGWKLGRMQSAGRARRIYHLRRRLAAPTSATKGGRNTHG